MIAMVVMALPLAAAQNSNDVHYNIEQITLPPLYTVPADATGPCDCIQLVFVIDNTGSMGGAINNVKVGLVNILNTAITESCGNLEAAVVTFYDDVYVLQAMTSNMTDVTNAINSMSASGGGNTPEASDQALQELVTSASCLTFGNFDPASWNPGCCRLAVLVTDAPPAGCDDNFTLGVDDANANNVAVALAGLGVKVGAILVGGPDAQAVPVMQNYASVTGGIYANTPYDGSGISDVIEVMVRACNSDQETELCCLPVGCTTVLLGTCIPLGGIPVPDCITCQEIPNETSSWGELKAIYK
jgi:hypothetical protein